MIFICSQSHRNSSIVDTALFLSSHLFPVTNLSLLLLFLLSFVFHSNFQYLHVSAIKRTHISIYTTQVNSGLCVLWLASWKVNSWYYSLLSSQTDKTLCQEFNFWLFCSILKEINWFWGIYVVYTKTIIHLKVNVSVRYLPDRKTVR